MGLRARDKAGNRSREQREADLVVTAELRLQGWTHGDIARKVGVGRTAILRDLKEIERRWREASIEAFNLIQQRELSRIDLVEKKAWEAWERSSGNGGNVRKTVTKRDAEGRVLETTTHEWPEAGGAQYLTTVLQCIDRRCKILGIAIEVKDPAGRDTRNPYDELAESERLAAIVAIFDSVAAQVDRAGAPEPRTLPPKSH